MSHYSNALSNKSDLFGNAGKKDATSSSKQPLPRPIVEVVKPKIPPSSSSSNGYVYKKSGGSTPTTFLKPDQIKRKEAEVTELRAKAKTAMKSGFFSSPDPLMAYTYYKKAAECYKSLGYEEFEALMRISCAECQTQNDSHSSSASDYKRAGELFSNLSKFQKSYECYSNSATAWATQGDMARAGEAFIMGCKQLDVGGLHEQAGKKFEEGVRIFVPDRFNYFKTFRSFGSEDKMDTSTLVTGAFAADNVYSAVSYFISTRNYSAALYAIGAVATLYEQNADATISLSKAYLTTTILILAMGDLVLADKTFIDVHLQSEHYLHSDHCRLAEDFITAVKTFDGDGLEKAKGDRCIQILDENVRKLCAELKISGKVKGAAAAVKEVKAVEEEDSEEGNDVDNEELARELAESMNMMSELENDMEDFEGAGEDEEEDDDDDDEFDLR